MCNFYDDRPIKRWGPSSYLNRFQIWITNNNGKLLIKNLQHVIDILLLNFLFPILVFYIAYVNFQEQISLKYSMIYCVSESVVLFY